MFTGSYPFDSAAEQTFIDRELPHLLGQFQVILVPKSTEGKRISTPFEVEVDEEFAFFVKKNSGFITLARKAFSSKLFLQEIRSSPRLLLYPAKVLKLILFLARAELTRDWLSHWRKLHTDSKHPLLYSYWFDHIATGLSIAKEKFPDLKVVSRAHGYDIYEEQYFPHYWPCRRRTLTLLDKVFPASDDGRDYFRKRFPEFQDLFETAHLGVKDPGFISEMSQDGVLRIISCSHIWPLKRIELLSQGIAVAAKMRSHQKFVWLHFGDGKGRKALQKAVAAHFPPNATGTFPGHVPNQEIMRHYREQPVDVFVNLSTTEGGAPVAIQEAISCGIPIIATDVGGNPEIVSDRNGLLLNPAPTPEEVAKALLTFCDNPEMARKMRAESRKVWQESYNADVNFRAFAERLKLIAES